ncbi:YetF domain-containing protein [Robertmurraya kyonggiensis]|uniref:DUF421 domain-containing protein n=1 Tax=Robertmurraya kyonggiensis TaxID=1037680 RepID=A0A4U1D7X9_9BACI|nr:DUF421 domain-containing protein [Robertmurraya kyonggiensis]TKC18093.1 DUF421 domain-containing protein [Robertmurraya kyonggiensis]
MGFVKDTLLVYGRIITLLPLLLFITLFMGKRSIGSLPIFDFLIIITLGAVVGADIADPNIAHIHTAMAIIGLALLQKLISYMTIRFRKFRNAITFEPTIVIMDGNFKVENLRKIQYSIDEILQMLREKDVFDVSEVKLGIIEANGNISVYKNRDKSPVLLEDMGIKSHKDKLPYPVIIEGKIDYQMLTKLSTSEFWLMEQLEKKGIKDINEVFFASLTSDLELHLSLMNGDAPQHMKH